MTGTQIKEMLGGLFVVIVFGVVVLLVMFVGQKQGFLEKKVTYTILFPNVSGLQDGAQVTLGGVSVGYIDKINLTYRDSRPFVKVEAIIFHRHTPLVRQDSQFNLSTVGVLGDTLLKITPGTKESPPLDPSIEIIGEEPFSIKQLTGGLDQFVQEIIRFADNAERFLEVTSTEVKTLGPNLQRTSSQFRQTALSMDETAKMLKTDAPGTLLAIKNASHAVEKLATTLDEQAKKGTLFKVKVF